MSQIKENEGVFYTLLWWWLSEASHKVVHTYPQNYE